MLHVLASRLVLLLYLYLGVAFQSLPVYLHRKNMPFFSMLSPSEESKLTVVDEISLIVDFYADQAKKNQIKGINPSILSEYAHLLAKGRLFERVIEEKIASCSNLDEVRIIEEVSDTLQGFISAERKSRSRLKISYILAGAFSDRLEDAVSVLSERYVRDEGFIKFNSYLFSFSDEIDVNLMNYLDSLIQREVMRVNGPLATIDDDDFKLDIEDGNKITLTTLKMIKRRLQAEIKTKDNKELRLLARLLHEKDLEVSPRHLHAESD